MSEFVTAAEAADILGFSETHVRRHIQSGTIAAEKVKGRWRIAAADLDGVDLGEVAPPNRPTNQTPSQPTNQPDTQPTNHTDALPPNQPTNQHAAPAWRDDLLAQVARLEADKVDMREDLGLRIEASKARVIDLESAATVRESRISDMETAHANEVSDLRGRVANLETELRESHSREAANALGWANRADELSHRIADLVDKHQQANERVYELEPVAEQVPMLQAAVDEKDATLTGIQDDIEAIASRPVAGPVFRLLTKGKLRI